MPECPLALKKVNRWLILFFKFLVIFLINILYKVKKLMKDSDLMCTYKSIWAYYVRYGNSLVRWKRG